MTPGAGERRERERERERETDPAASVGARGPSREAGLRWLSPLCLRLSRGTLVRAAGLFVGHSPVDRAHRLSRCRQYGSAGTPPSRKAVPVGVVPVPPIHLFCL